MKKYIIVSIAILLISIILSGALFQVQAVGLDTVTSNPSQFITQYQEGDTTKVQSIANIIVGIIQAVGTAISILMLSIIGIKYIMGSVEDKAQYKQTMWTYIIGALLIFGGSSVVSIIYKQLSSMR